MQRRRRSRRAARGRCARSQRAGVDLLGCRRAGHARAHGGRPGGSAAGARRVIRPRVDLWRRPARRPALPGLGGARLRARVQRPRPDDTPSGGAAEGPGGRPRVPGQSPAGPRGAGRGVLLPSSRPAAGATVPARRQRLGGSRPRAQPPLSRACHDSRAQRAQLLAAQRAERLTREHGGERVLSPHSDLRGGGRVRLRDHRRVGGRRDVPHARGRGTGRARRSGGRGGPRAARRAARPAHRRRCPRAHPRGAHLCASRCAGRGDPGGCARMRVVILGLSVTSSWGNGHATNYRALIRALDRRGHDVLFLERDVPWYAAHRDLPRPPWGRTVLYDSPAELRGEHGAAVRSADLVVVGSYVPDGVAVGEWVTERAGGVTAFYDINTPVTLAKLDRGDHEYLAPHLVPRYQLYLSFTGGPTLERVERELGSPCARAFHCLVDPELYYPERVAARWDLGYLGTYSADRQPALERLLLEPARRHDGLRCVVAGPQYPDDIDWPPNVERIEHVPPARHRAFYAAQRFTVNVTRSDMARAGWSPSVRLFEAGACAVPVISDRWEGLDTFFEPGREIIAAERSDDVLHALAHADGPAIGAAARARVLRDHTASHRVEQLEALVERLPVRA